MSTLGRKGNCWLQAKFIYTHQHLRFFCFYKHIWRYVSPNRIVIHVSYKNRQITSYSKASLMVCHFFHRVVCKETQIAACYTAISVLYALTGVNHITAAFMRMNAPLFTWSECLVFAFVYLKWKIKRVSKCEYIYGKGLEYPLGV